MATNLCFRACLRDGILISMTAVEYIDELFKNVVTDPKEVSTKGFDYFEEAEDILTPEKLLGEIESFLRGRS